ncbi:hypothetical protein B5F40_01970 [Gordonibacter sp. An230]|nr:hypothetical protein B5F40_01970 [Gordonibacter sp. An230]
MALPILLLFLFAAVDLGRAVFLGMALEDAAYAACRTACEEGAEGATSEALRNAALRESPALSGDGLTLEASMQVGEVQRGFYDHRLFDEGEGSFVQRPSQTAHRPVRVILKLEGAYLTPVGAIMEAASGGAGSGFSYETVIEGMIDETVGGGAW